MSWEDYEETKHCFRNFNFVVFSLAWGREDRLSNRGLAPAAAGVIVSSNDNNGNTAIDIKVEHMASPQALTPARHYYVVWIQPRGE